MRLLGILAAEGILEGALRGAVTGAIVGAVLGLGYWVFLQVKKRTSTKDETKEPPGEKK